MAFGLKLGSFNQQIATTPFQSHNSSSKWLYSWYFSSTKLTCVPTCKMREAKTKTKNTCTRTHTHTPTIQSRTSVKVKNHVWPNGMTFCEISRQYLRKIHSIHTILFLFLSSVLPLKW